MQKDFLEVPIEITMLNPKVNILKMNISFIVHFFLGKYSFTFNIFLTHYIHLSLKSLKYWFFSLKVTKG